MLVILLIIFAAGPIQGIDSTSDYLIYYGTWNSEKVFRAKDFDLVILAPSGISSEQVMEIRAGHDGILGTDDDVMVIGYLSIGEDEVGNHVGDGRGPCYYDWRGDSVIYENRGVASWYVDDRDTNGIPDRNGTWGSYYVNAGDSLWWQFVEEKADAIMAKGCDGLFLDTIDTASPCSWGVPYCWTKEGMSALVAHLRQLYPDKILIANRGLFYFDPSFSDYYAITIRPYINGVLFENYYLEWDWNSGTAHVSPWFGENRTYWAPRVNNEARKPDGFTVFCLDYLNPGQINYQSLLDSQIVYTIIDQGWVDYISHINLDVIRYDVFHHHPDGDRNPPTWDTTIGLQIVRAENTSVTLHWNNATDQTPPVRYNIYYLDRPFTDPSDAHLISHVTPTPDTLTTWRYVVTDLHPNTTYYFLVRAVDSSEPEHEDHNLIIRNTETGGERRIIIDGNFGDWEGLPRLDSVPQSDELQGDASSSDADIVDLWCIEDDSVFYFSYTVAGNFNHYNNYYHLFLDTDMNASTGYPFGAIGADYMVENNNLFRYTGSGDWSWTPISGIEIVYSGNRVEMGISKDTIGLEEQVRIILNVNSASPPYESLDYAPDDWANNFYVYPYNTGISEPVPTVNLRFEHDFLYLTLLKPGDYSISIIDIAGRVRSHIYSGYLNTGTHKFRIPDGFTGGLYFVLIKGPTAHESLKVIII